MPNYTIYTHIYSIMNGFTYFKRFCRFWLYKAQPCDLKMFLGPSGSKKQAKEAQNISSWLNRAKYPSSRRSIKTQRSRNGEARAIEATTAWPWCLPQTVDDRPVVFVMTMAAIFPLGSLVFLAAIRFPCKFGRYKQQFCA